jgi:hypothetical protein
LGFGNLRRNFVKVIVTLNVGLRVSGNGGWWIAYLLDSKLELLWLLWFLSVDCIVALDILQVLNLWILGCLEDNDRKQSPKSKVGVTQTGRKAS